jgi:hypothetical protein
VCFEDGLVIKNRLIGLLSLATFISFNHDSSFGCSKAFFCEAIKCHANCVDIAKTLFFSRDNFVGCHKETSQKSQ